MKKILRPNQLVKGKIDIWLLKLSSFLFLLLLPTQFGLHIWPSYSYVYGLKVDYLSPTLYISDIAFFVYLFAFVKWQGIWEIKKIILKRRKVIFILIGFITINILVSLNIFVTIFKWIKILEWGSVVFIVSRSFEKVEKNAWFAFLISTSAVFIVGLLQVVNGHTLNGVFYFLGERNFNVLTPGISLVNIFGSIHMRAYSIFSHPNSMAGFELIIFLLFLKWRAKSRLVLVGIILSFFSVLLTFSRGAYLALIISGLIYFFGKRIISKHINLVIICFFVLSLVLLVFSNTLPGSLPESLRVRIQLLQLSGGLFMKNPIFGIGLGSFVGEYSSSEVQMAHIFSLQPVHNIPILILVETGVVGLILFFMALMKLVTQIKINKNRLFYTCILIAILFTSFFDHYFLTLQQNFLLTAFLTGTILSSKI